MGLGVPECVLQAKEGDGLAVHHHVRELLGDLRGILGLHENTLRGHYLVYSHSKRGAGKPRAWTLPPVPAAALPWIPTPSVPLE